MEEKETSFGLFRVTWIRGRKKTTFYWGKSCRGDTWLATERLRVRRHCATWSQKWDTHAAIKHDNSTVQTGNFGHGSVILLIGSYQWRPKCINTEGGSSVCLTGVTHLDHRGKLSLATLCSYMFISHIRRSWSRKLNCIVYSVGKKIWKELHWFWFIFIFIEMFMPAYNTILMYLYFITQVSSYLPSWRSLL